MHRTLLAIALLALALAGCESFIKAENGKADCLETVKPFELALAACPLVKPDEPDQCTEPAKLALQAARTRCAFASN
jgi:hypothetical protein